MGYDFTPRIEAGKRRSERVLLRIPIEVTGQDQDGKSFREKTFTVVINRHGARIALKTSVRAEARVTITNLQTAVTCPFRVVGRTGKSLGEGPEWGVECLELGVNFWGIYFPALVVELSWQESVDALLECSVCRSRELAQLTLDEYRSAIERSSVERRCPECGERTSWNFGLAEVGAKVFVPRQPIRGREVAPPAREAKPHPGKRLTIKLPIRIRLQDGMEEVARTENLSKTGVCFVSTLMMKVQERILLTLGYAPGGEADEVPARVVWRREMEGASRALYGVRLDSPEGQRTLVF